MSNLVRRRKFYKVDGSLPNLNGSKRQCQETISEEIETTNLSDPLEYSVTRDNIAQCGSCTGTNFCGVVTSKSQNNLSPTYLQPQNEKLKRSFTSAQKLYHAATTGVPLSNPVDVPLRNKKSLNRKNCRSSGGYFFDKYMTGFLSKKNVFDENVIHKSKSDNCRIDENNNGTMECEMQEIEDSNHSPVKNFKSNRQDMLIQEQSQSLDSISSPFDNFTETDDDLYPSRIGMSRTWTAYCISPEVLCYKPSHPTSLNINGNRSEQIEPSLGAEEENMPLSPLYFTVFPPSSSPLVWGDVYPTQVEDYSPVSSPLSMDCYESHCSYSDSNSVTLKAMETLYLCNFVVSVNGDWLCLREVNDVSHAVMAYQPSGLYYSIIYVL